LKARDIISCAVVVDDDDVNDWGDDDVDDW